MYWTLKVLPPGEEETKAAADPCGRFVLQRHRDREGAHLDLRLEQDGCCCGWRIDGAGLEEGAPATEKGPHPLRWLEQDGNAERLDQGRYGWEYRRDGEGVLVLHGRDGTRRVAVSRVKLLPLSAVRAVHDAVIELGVEPGAAAQLLRDGHLARRRAVARFYGLGRELDGRAFDEALWRRTLRECSLEEVESHLRGYEIRFDEKNPPVPVSRPEALDEEDASGDASRAMAILAVE